jgi:hypothetical protein
MTAPSPPGTLCLRIARLLLADQVVSAVFLPAIADFQAEMQQRSLAGLPRFLTRCRWLCDTDLKRLSLRR